MRESQPLERRTSPADVSDDSAAAIIAARIRSGGVLASLVPNPGAQRANSLIEAGQIRVDRTTWVRGQLETIVADDAVQMFGVKHADAEDELVPARGPHGAVHLGCQQVVLPYIQVVVLNAEITGGRLREGDDEGRGIPGWASRRHCWPAGSAPSHRCSVFQRRAVPNRDKRYW